jgi:hypothetical protein
MQRAAIANRLNILAVQLGQNATKLGDLIEAEHRGKMESLEADLTGGETSISRAEKVAAIRTYGLTCKIMKLKGEIEADREERDQLRFLIKYGMEDFV